MNCGEKPGSVATTITTRLRLAAMSFCRKASERHSRLRRGCVATMTPPFSPVSSISTLSPQAWMLFLPRGTHRSTRASAVAVAGMSTS